MYTTKGQALFTMQLLKLLSCIGSHALDLPLELIQTVSLGAILNFTDNFKAIANYLASYLYIQIYLNIHIKGRLCVMACILVHACYATISPDACAPLLSRNGYPAYIIRVNVTLIACSYFN